MLRMLSNEIQFQGSAEVLEHPVVLLSGQRKMIRVSTNPPSKSFYGIESGWVCYKFVIYFISSK